MLSILRLYWISYLASHSLYIGCRFDTPPSPSLWPPAQPSPGGKILKRRFDLAGCSVEMPGRIAWATLEGSHAWHEQFYSFRWLRDIALNRKHKETASFAREFINGFILEGQELPPAAWQMNVTAERLALWMEHLELILEGSSKIFRQRFARSVIRHVLFLKRALESQHSDEGSERHLAALWGLVAAARRFRPLRFLMPQACRILALWLQAGVREDGMYASGKPADQMTTLQMLIDLRALLSTDAPVYTELARTISRMGNMLRFCCHGDGRLALFGGTIMQDAPLIASIIDQSHPAPEEFPIIASNQLGRLRRAQSCVFLLAAYGESPLAMEFSEGAERIVVNCGGYLGTDPMWEHAVRTPAAHSTLSLEGAPSPASPEYQSPPPRIESLNAPEGQMLRATLEPWPGIIHTRILLLHEDGTRLTGKDQITCQLSEASSIDATLRFHLHPDLRCQKISEQAVSLTSVSGKKWICSVRDGLPLSVEESVYLGYKGKPQRTLQLVLRPTLSEGMTEIKWEFKK